MGWGVKRWGSEYCAERFEIVERNACFNEVLLRCFDCFFDDRFVRLALHKVSLSFSGPLSGTTAELDIASHEHAGLAVSVGINERFIRGCQKSGGSMSQSQTVDVLVVEFERGSDHHRQGAVDGPVVLGSDTTSIGPICKYVLTQGPMSIGPRATRSGAPRSHQFHQRRFRAVCSHCCHLP